MFPITTIYSIYTVEDQDYMLDFLGYLNPLLERYNASVWHDDVIPIGDIWRPKDNSRIPNTDLFLFFVSHNFMYSEFINQIEFKWIIDSYKEGNCKVILILIDDCPWEIDFKSEDYNFSFTELLVLPKRQKPISNWRNQNRAFESIISEVKRALANLAERHKYEAENYEEHNLIIDEKIERLEEQPANTAVIDSLEMIEAEEISETGIEKIASIEIGKKPRKAHKRIAAEIKRVFAVFTDNNPVQAKNKGENIPVFKEYHGRSTEEDSLSFKEEQHFSDSEENSTETAASAIHTNKVIYDDVTVKTADEFEKESKELNFEEEIVLFKESNPVQNESGEDDILNEEELDTTIKPYHTLPISNEENKAILEELVSTNQVEEFVPSLEEEFKPIAKEVNFSIEEEIKGIKDEGISIEVQDEIEEEKEPEITVTSDGLIVLENEIALIDDIEMAFIINEGIISIAKEKNTPIINEDIALLEAQEFVPILEGEIQRIENEINLIKNIVEKQRFNVSRGEWKVEKKRYKRRSSEYKSKILAAVVVSVFCFAAFIFFKEDPVKKGPIATFDYNKAASESILLIDLNIGESYKGGIIFNVDKTKQLGKIVSFEDAGPMSWDDAMKIDEQLGEGWRLPTLEELTILHQVLGQGANNTAAFSNELYWSSTTVDKDQASLLRFGDANTSYHYNVEVGNKEFHVRAVKDFMR